MGRLPGYERGHLLGAQSVDQTVTGAISCRFPKRQQRNESRCGEGGRGRASQRESVLRSLP